MAVKVAQPVRLCPRWRNSAFGTVVTPEPSTYPLADLATDETNKVIEFHTRWPHSNLSYLTIDGTHVNAEGNIIMATGVLKALGFTDAQIAREKNGWLDLGASMISNGGVVLTVRQSEQMHDLAEAQGQSAENYITKVTPQALPTILSQPPPPDTPPK